MGFVRLEEYKLDFLMVHDWAIWQSYRTDRGQPPWIKIHRCLMRNFKWVSLNDEERGHLISIWLLAADNEGKVPNDSSLIQRLCYLQKKPNINKLIDLSFLDVISTPTRRQVDIVNDVPEKNRIEKRREEIEKKYSEDIFCCVITYLNSKTGKNFKITLSNTKYIQARIGEGYGLDDFIQVIDNQVADEWFQENTKFLRPQTLFNSEKFPGYLANKPKPRKRFE